jgi:hypothetical protein
MNLELSWPLVVVLLASVLGGVFLLRRAISQMCSVCGHGPSHWGAHMREPRRRLGPLWLRTLHFRFHEALPSEQIRRANGGKP